MIGLNGNFSTIVEIYDIRKRMLESLKQTFVIFSYFPAKPNKSKKNEHLLLQPIWANYVICGRAFYSLPKSAVTAISPQELAFTAILGNDFCKAIG